MHCLLDYVQYTKVIKTLVCPENTFFFLSFYKTVKLCGNGQFPPRYTWLFDSLTRGDDRASGSLSLEGRNELRYCRADFSLANVIIGNVQFSQPELIPN